MAIDPTAPPNWVAAAIEAGQALGAVRATKEGGQFTIVPAGSKVQEFDHERLLPNPTRKRAAVKVQDAASFIAYYNLFSDEHSVVFADAATQSFKAVLDYHFTGDGPARWGEHTVTYACPKTVEWQTWNGSNGKQMSQVAFAQFIEDNLDDIVDPPGAKLLEITKTLEAKKNVNFSSSVRLDNGQAQFVYQEELTGSAAKGTIEIPEQFSLGIPVFYGSDNYRVRCRLRWRIAEGKLTFWYNMNRPDRILEDSFKTVYAQIASETKAKIVKGTP